MRLTQKQQRERMPERFRCRAIVQILIDRGDRIRGIRAAGGR